MEDEDHKFFAFVSASGEYEWDFVNREWVANNGRIGWDHWRKAHPPTCPPPDWSPPQPQPETFSWEQVKGRAGTYVYENARNHLLFSDGSGYVHWQSGDVDDAAVEQVWINRRLISSHLSIPPHVAAKFPQPQPDSDGTKPLPTKPEPQGEPKCPKHEQNYGTWAQCESAWRAYHAAQTAALRAQLAGGEKLLEDGRKLATEVCTMHDDLFRQSLSNGIKTARGEWIDCTKINNVCDSARAHLGFLSGGGAA